MWIPSTVKLHFVFSPGEVAAEGNFLNQAAMLALKVIITCEIQSPARCRPIREHILGWRRGRDRKKVQELSISRNIWTAASLIPVSLTPSGDLLFGGQALRQIPWKQIPWDKFPGNKWSVHLTWSEPATCKPHPRMDEAPKPWSSRDEASKARDALGLCWATVSLTVPVDGVRGAFL